jgi:hypothetical protein
MRETADRHTSPTPAPPADVPQDDPMEDVDPTMSAAGPVPDDAGHPVDATPIPVPAMRSPSPTVPPPTPSPGLVPYGSPSLAPSLAASPGPTPPPLSPGPASRVADSSGDVQMDEDPGAETSGMAAAMPLAAVQESVGPTPSPNTVISVLRQAGLMIPTPMDILARAEELTPMEVDPGASPETMPSPTPRSSATRDESVPRLFREFINTSACASSPARPMTAGSSGSQRGDSSVPAPVLPPVSEWIRLRQEAVATQSPPAPPPPTMPPPSPPPPPPPPTESPAPAEDDMELSMELSTEEEN